MSIKQRRVNRQFSAQEFQDLQAMLVNMEQLFNFSHSLSPAERSRLIRVSTVNKDFLHDIHITVQDYPWVLPGYVTKTEFDNEYGLYFQLEDLISALMSQIDRMKQTQLIVANNLMRDSLDVYGNMKQAVERGVAELISHLNRTETRFAGQGNFSPVGSGEADASGNGSDGGTGDGDAGSGSGSTGGSGDAGGTGGSGGSGGDTGSGDSSGGSMGQPDPDPNTNPNNGGGSGSGSDQTGS